MIYSLRLSNSCRVLLKKSYLRFPVTVEADNSPEIKRSVGLPCLSQVPTTFTDLVGPCGVTCGQIYPISFTIIIIIYICI